MEPDWDLERAVQVVGLLATKWTVPVIAALWDGPIRRSALHHALSEVTDKVLTATLRRLEDHGAVARSVVNGTPPRVVHALTARGRSLGAVLHAMSEWATTERRDQ